ALRRPWALERGFSSGAAREVVPIARSPASRAVDERKGPAADEEQQEEREREVPRPGLAALCLRLVPELRHHGLLLLVDLTRVERRAARRAARGGCLGERHVEGDLHAARAARLEVEP